MSILPALYQFKPSAVRIFGHLGARSESGEDKNLGKGLYYASTSEISETRVKAESIGNGNEWRSTVSHVIGTK